MRHVNLEKFADGALSAQYNSILPNRKEYGKEKAAADACRSYPADKEAGFR